jgi:hypothetical protein
MGPAVDPSEALHFTALVDSGRDAPMSAQYRSVTPVRWTTLAAAA